MRVRKVDGQDIVTCPRCGATGLVFGGWVFWNSGGVSWLDNPGRGPDGMDGDTTGCGYDVLGPDGDYRNGYWASTSRLTRKGW